MSPFLLQLIAQTTDYDYSTTGNEVGGAVVAGLGIFMIIVWLVVILFGVFTLWMLIDAIVRKEEDYQVAGAGSKILWIVLILFLGFIPAIIYFFLGRKKAKKAAVQITAAPVSAPTQEAPTPVAPEKKEEAPQTKPEEKEEENPTEE